MKKGVIRHRIFYRYLFSYLAIFLVPFLVLSFLILSVFLKDFKENAREKEKDLILQTMENSDREWETVDRLALSIGSNTAFLPEFINRTPYSPREAIGDLAMYRDQSSLYLDILYTPVDTKKSYGSTSSYFTRELEGYYLNILQRQGELHNYLQGNSPFPETLGATEVMFYQSSWNKKKLFITRKSVPLNSLRPYGTLLFLIYPEELFKEPVWLARRSGGSFSVTDREGSLIYSFDNPRSGETDQRVLVLSSSETGWTYQWSLPAYTGYEDVERLERQFILAVLFSLLFATGIILVMMRLNYSPLASMRKTLEERLNRDIDNSDSLEGLENMVRLIIDKNCSLEELVQNSSALFKEKLLRGILLEELDDDEIDGICRQIGCPLHYSRYRTAVLTPCSSRSVSRDWLNRSVSYGKTAFSYTGEAENPVFGCLSFKGYFVLVFAGESAGETYPALLADLLGEFEEVLDLSLVGGLGETYSSRRDLSLSCGEAILAVEENIHRTGQDIFLFADLSKRSRWSNGERQEMLQDLKGSLLAGNVERWQKGMERLTHHLKRTPGTLPVTRHFLINLFEYSESVLPELNSGNDLPSLAGINDMTSLEEILRILGLLNRNVTSLLEKGVGNSLIERTRDIIARDYGDPNLSVEDISRRLGVSYSHLSRTFKSVTGTGLNVYLIRYRIERFKELAAEERAPLNELIVKVGYRGTYQFGRIFKKQEGMTPSEFRIQLREQK